jgi:hypothetical protein
LKSIASGVPGRFHVLAVTTPGQSITAASLQQSARLLPRSVKLDDKTRMGGNSVLKVLG